MNWITKIKTFGDKIKRNLQKNFQQKKKLQIQTGQAAVKVLF